MSFQLKKVKFRVLFKILVKLKNNFFKNIDIDEALKEVPFQLQIIYNAKDGSKALRVLTQKKPLTTDKSLAEAGKN